MTDQDCLMQSDDRPRPAAFLDRDGVINVDHGYVFQPDDLCFTPTAIEGIRLLNEADYWVFVVSNQSGVARGLYSVEDVERFHAHMQAQLASEGARIDAFYYCPYHPHGSIASYRGEHEDRKPNPGMLLRAMREWPVIRQRSFMIGDKPSDVEAADRARMPVLLVPSDTCDLAAAASAMVARLHGEVATAADHS